MGKRSAVVELFLGDMGSMQRELRPSIQREDQPTMETKLEQIAVKAVNQLPKSVVREIRTPRSVGTGGGRPPPVTRWVVSNGHLYRDHYTGMAAMREHVELSYDGIFVALSLITAIGASTAALWLAFRTTDLGQQLIAAVVMGLAISGMPYTAGGGTTFAAHGPVPEAHGYASLDQTNLALAVAGTTFVILASALIASLSEQKRAEEALREAQADLAHVSRVTQ